MPQAVDRINAFGASKAPPPTIYVTRSVSQPQNGHASGTNLVGGGALDAPDCEHAGHAYTRAVDQINAFGSSKLLPYEG